MTPYMILNNLNDWYLEPTFMSTFSFITPEGIRKTNFFRVGEGGGRGGAQKGNIDSKRVNDFVAYFTAFKNLLRDFVVLVLSHEYRC